MKNKYKELADSIIGGDHLDGETVMRLMVNSGFDNHTIVQHLGDKYIDETSVENYRKEFGEIHFVRIERNYIGYFKVRGANNEDAVRKAQEEMDEEMNDGIQCSEDIEVGKTFNDITDGKKDVDKSTQPFDVD